VLGNPVAGTLGDQALRNGCSGPRFYNVDMNLVKKTRITERVTFEFRAEFFNIFNHPTFSANGTNINNSGFAKMSSSTVSSPREVQFNARLNF
jgi:hypothetical protein